MLDPQIALVAGLYPPTAGYGLTEAERPLFESAGADPTYGELDLDFVAELLANLPEPLAGDDVFFDLGSGLGKVCLLAYLTTPVGRVVGVELSPQRHRQASEALQRLRASHPTRFAADRPLHLLQGDLLDVDLSTATVVFLLSTSWPRELLGRLTERLTTGCPRLRLVISSRSLPEDRLERRVVIPARCAYARSETVTLYHPQERT